MKRGLPIFIVVVTAVLVVMAWFQSGGAERREMRSANAPDQAVRLMLSQIQARNFDAAYARLANKGDVDRTSFVREFAGSYGSLLTYASLENYEVWGLHSGDQEATVRAKLHYSTAVGPLDDVRDMKVEKAGDTWKVSWPVNTGQKLPPQVIPVNYLRWDIIHSDSEENEWGAQNVESPHVRITSMNAVESEGKVIILGELVNEDTVPGYVDVQGILIGKDGEQLGEETSFDNISHVLLPKEVTPFRIDFDGIHLNQVKKVTLNPTSMLVPASADPVIGVLHQQLDKTDSGHTVLKGELMNQSGQLVNIPQVLATYYDNAGKVIWISDGYVDQALRPQIAVPFAVSVNDDIAPKVHSYRVVVNHYIMDRSAG